MTINTRVLQRFSYYAEDLDCCACLYRIPKNERKIKSTSCGKEACRFDDIREKAIANGRIKRPRGWFSCKE